MQSIDTPGNTPNNTGVTKFTLIVFIVCIMGIILISIYIYDYIRIKVLKSEIDKLDYNNIDFDKKLYDYINTHLTKTDFNIKDINENLTKTDLNIEKLNTVINSYINSSIQKNKLNEISLNSSSTSQSSINDINTYLQEYITANDEKLDAYILDTNARLDELTETNTIIMDSINNINNKLNL